MGSEDSTDSSVSAQKEKGTKFGSKLKGAFGSMAKAVKGSKPEKRFFGREKVKDDYIESLECINGIHSNSDPELPDITKRNVMPGRFAKVEAPKIRTEIRPKTYEVMDEVPADDAEEDNDLEMFEAVEEETTKVSETIDVVPAAAEPVAETVFIRETEKRFYEEEAEEETEEEGEVDYFDFLPPMKATERAPVRRAPQSRSVVDINEHDNEDVQEEVEAEAEEEEAEEEQVRTKEEVFIDLFDEAPETPAVTADIEDEPAVAEIPVSASTEDVDGEPVRTIDLDILDVPVVIEIQESEIIVENEIEIELKIETGTIVEAAVEKDIAIEEEIVITVAEREIEIQGTTKEETFIDLFENVDGTPARTVIDLDILDTPEVSAVQEETAEEDDEPETIPEIQIPIETETPIVQETQRAVPEAAIPAYGRLSIDFDAFDRAAESPLDSRFDVEEVEHVHVPQAEISFDIASLESASIPAVGEEVMIEMTEVQASPINVEIDHKSLETLVSPINVEIDYESLETLVSPINVEIDYESLETLVSPINVMIDLAGLKTPVSPINVEIDMISLTARTVIEVQTEDRSAYVPNFVLVNDEDVVEAGSELSAMMPETVLKTFDSEHEFLEIDVLDVMDDIVTEVPTEVPEQEVRAVAGVQEEPAQVQEPALSDLMPETMLKAFDSEHGFLEIDVLDIAEECDDLEIDESEITEVPETSEPNYLEIDASEIMEFLEIDESEITEVPDVSEPNYLEIDVSDVMEFLEIDESEITEVPEVATPVREAKVFARAEGAEEKGGIFFSFFSKEDKEDNISISFGETKEDDDVMDDSGESVSVRDDYAVTVSPVDGSRKLFI